MRNIKRLWMLILGVSLGIALLLPLAAMGAVAGLTNPGLEAPFVPYGTYNGWNLQVANGWERFFVPDNTYKNGSRLRFFSASDWAAFNGSPVTERVEGENAQVWWSSSTKKFDAGVYQQIGGLTVGESYGFQAGILQVFETTNRTDPATGVMARRVGIDPTGGTDPESPNVVWSPLEEHATFSSGGKKYTWFWPSVGAQAQATTMTVFIRVSSKGQGSTPNSDQVWADDTFFDIAPTTTLTLTPIGATQLRAEWSGSPRPGFVPYASEAQYRRISDTTWTDLQVFDVLDSAPPTGTSATFSIVEGETYIVRARTWHERDVNGRTHQVAGPWVEAQYPPAQTGGIVAGRVLLNTEWPLGGARVQVTGAATATTSDSNGDYSLETGGGTFGITATHPSGWAAPSPVRATVAATETLPLTITLRPPDDVIRNGDFEGTLTGWQSALAASTFITENHRAGNSSLCVSGAGVITQSGVVSDMYRPVLSFWYRRTAGGGLTAEIFGSPALTPTAPLSLTAPVGKWQHAYLPLDLPGRPLTGTGSLGSVGTGSLGSFALPLYSGEVGVRFTFGGTGTVCVDEVSLGRSWGGVHTIFLPLILKG
ncbi:MAG: carboxypeptidase regulatory-like domain-containing protein [Caldilineae bacterium]|nr:MAG: carboxypeptidase regulatory-like domain-containing protein [Caldilineae bacterium]